MSATKLVYNLNLHDFYAAAALNAILGNPEYEGTTQDICIMSHQYASQMLALRGDFVHEHSKACDCVSCVGTEPDTTFYHSAGVETSNTEAVGKPKPNGNCFDCGVAIKIGNKRCQSCYNTYANTYANINTHHPAPTPGCSKCGAAPYQLCSVDCE